MAGQTPLVGRTDEIKSLTATIGDGFGVTVEGPAGIGKTSLIRQVATELADQFALVPVSATQASQAIPLGALSGHLIDAPPASDDLTRVQEALLGQASGRPLLVVVDDGHLLDDYSAVAIHQLAVTGKALVLATARDGQRGSSAFESLVTKGLSERLVLSPLDHAGVEAMMAVRLGGPMNSRLAQDAWLASRGVPMVVSLLVESGVREGTITRQHGLWTRVGAFTAEPRLLSLIGAQLDQLTPAERSAVDMLALAEPLESALVDHLVPPNVITSLRNKGIVVGVDSDGDSALRLVHPLFGEAARPGITDERRRATIAALAQTLETAEDADADMLLRVAMWGAAAECRLDPDLMVRAASVVRTRSIDSAIHLLRAAMAAGGSPPVLLELVRALVLAGRVDEAEGLLVGYDPEGLTPVERVAACLTRAIGLVWTVQRPEAALALVDLERSTSGHDPLLSALLDAAESGAHLVLGDVDSATRTGLRALSGPDIGPEAGVTTAIAVGVALTQQGRAETALDVTGQWLGAADRMRSSAPPLNAALRGARFEALYYGGHLATLAIEADEAFAQAVEGGDEFVVSRASHYLSRLALLGARPTQAVRHSREALVALDGFDRMFVAWNLAHLAGALALSGATSEARLMLDQCDAAGPLAAIFAADRLRAEVAILAAEGQVGQAAERSVTGAHEAMGHGLTTVALWCWFDAARLGNTDAVSELATLPPVDGPLAAACHCHVVARAGHDGDALDRASAHFASLGVDLYAAEAAMDAAAAHQRHGSPTKAAASLERARSHLDPADPVATPALTTPPSAVAALTAREREVAQLATQGLSDRAIAEQLSLSVRTVETHLTRTYAKLGLPGRTELTSVFMASSPG